MPTSRTASPGPLVVAALAGVAHLVVGYFYVVGGLVIPGYVLIPLWLFWAGLALVLIRLAFQRSWWTASIPVLAAAVLALTLVVGGNLLGWQA
ncbi:hypothetical protein [Blastococcus brunescens]|uniref:Uncharacterized protein n=1 Tax=Blastococcus brunescens TaxID=1564165 RepID=A0ABZ1ATH4_9ACTN|nr:hypothetical protein [Blastococcus sp. BMG 8361]WRL61875.1 hypothetical protein U6N30_17355 [Blastococcus sp. BMG 8361]